MAMERGKGGIRARSMVGSGPIRIAVVVEGMAGTGIMLRLRLGGGVISGDLFFTRLTVYGAMV
jgi:hypothetical protein